MLEIKAGCWKHLKLSIADNVTRWCPDADLVLQEEVRLGDRSVIICKYAMHPSESGLETRDRCGFWLWLFSLFHLTHWTATCLFPWTTLFFILKNVKNYSAPWIHTILNKGLNYELVHSLNQTCYGCCSYHLHYCNTIDWKKKNGKKKPHYTLHYT